MGSDAGGCGLVSEAGPVQDVGFEAWMLKVWLEACWELQRGDEVV